MHVHVLTIFPELFASPLAVGVVKRAREAWPVPSPRSASIPPDWRPAGPTAARTDFPSPWQRRDRETMMLYLAIMLWPYLLIAFAAGLVIGWFGSDRIDA